MCRVVESGSLAAPVMSCEIMCQVMSEQSNEALITIITYSCTVSDLVTMLWSMFVFLFKCFPKQNVYQWQLNMIFDVGSGLVWAQRHWSIRHNGINGIIIELLSRHIQSPMSPTIQYHVQKYNSIQNFSKPNRMCKSFISILYHCTDYYRQEMFLVSWVFSNLFTYTCFYWWIQWQYQHRWPVLCIISIGISWSKWQS